VTAPLRADVVESPAPKGEVRSSLTIGRTPRQLAWRRLKQDRVALAGGVVVLVLLLVAVFASLLSKFEGQGPYTFHQDLIDPTYSTPLGAAGGISGTHWLGVEPTTGRDLFSRMVYGAQVSLLIAVAASLVSVVIGAVLGAVAGYFGGGTDGVISRSMDVLLAFPLLLFAIALVAVADQVNRKLLLILIIGFFNWPYVGRIIRGQTISLREREFVDAARALGAGPGHVIFRELLPNLVAPILVYATLIIPTNILFETSLSFLGVGIRPPEASWGQMLNDASSGLYQIDPEYMIVPGVAVFITVLAFNLFGDGLRDALDPRSNR